MLNYVLFFNLIAFSLFLLIHVFLWRIIYGYRGVLLILFVSLISYLITFILFFKFSLITIDDSWVLLPVYSCLIMLYTHLYVGILKSVSIRLLEELYESQDKRMSISDIEILYSTKEMVSTRVELLKEKGWLKEENLSYTCDKKAVITVKVNLFIQKIFRLKNTG